MTSGVILFAYNSTVIDYIKIAVWNAHNIHRHLHLPVTLITDEPIDNSVFERVIVNKNPGQSVRYFHDIEQTSSWKNTNRYRAYELSPYDTTLLLDIDYVVASSQLQSVINDPRTFVCYQHAIEITGTAESPTTFGRTKFPMSWATVVKFSRSELSKNVFDIIGMIQQNYKHYANLYNFTSKPFRNDYALSIALSMVQGHRLSNENAIAGSLINVNPGHRVTQVDKDCYEIVYDKMVNSTAKSFKIITKNQDLHVMGKSYLEAIANG